MLSDLIHSLISFDYKLFELINQHLQQPFLDVLMPILRNKYTWLPVYFGLILYIYITNKNKFIIYILFIIICISIIDISNHHLLKPFFARKRPCFNSLIQTRLLIESCGGKWSFPSSHAANHFGLTTALFLLGIFKNKFLIILLFSWPILIGFAQIYVGVHYPFDIIAGFFYGEFVVLILYRIVFIKLLKK